MANPTLLTTPFCAIGEKNEIPVVQPAEGDGRFNQYTGFPSETSIPTINGGKNVSRQDMNGAFYFLSNILFQVQKGKIFEWDSNQDYYTPALVLYNNTIYFCKADIEAGGVTPTEDTTHTYWIKLVDYLYGIMKTEHTIQYTDVQGTPTKLSQFSNTETDFQNGAQVTTAVSTAVNPIMDKTPQAIWDKTTNEYADKDWVNSSINAIAAYYITKNAAGDPFNTVAELVNATSYYCGGVKRTPTRNDYAVVLRDENHDGHSTRYTYNNQWEYQYTYNLQFTEVQMKAINSGIDSTLTAQITTNKNNIELKANAADLATVAFSGDYEDLNNPYVLPIATKGVLGGVKQGDGVLVKTDGTLTIDTSTLVNVFDWTQLNTSEKMHNNGTSGVIDLANGRVQVTTATTIKMPVPLPNCCTWVTLWCNSGSVTFDTSLANVYFEDGNTPPAGTGVYVYTLASIGGNAWYCMFTGRYPTA